jgi:hypothetical protein
MGNSEDVMLTRERYKESLDKCHTFLKESLKEEEVELKAESLRLAS